MAPGEHHHIGKDGGRGFILMRSLDGSYHWTTPLGRTAVKEPMSLWEPPPARHGTPVRSERLASQSAGTGQPPTRASAPVSDRAILGTSVLERFGPVPHDSDDAYLPAPTRARFDLQHPCRLRRPIEIRRSRRRRPSPVHDPPPF